MSSIIGSAAGTIIATQLPFDHSTNIALGMASNQLVQYGLDKFGNFTERLSDKLWEIIGWEKKAIRICVRENNKLNSIHKKLEEYILEKYIAKLSVCNLVPMKGDIVIDLRDAFFKIPMEVVHNDHKIYMAFSSESKEVVDDNVTRRAKTIIVYSYTASIHDMKTFITNLVKLVKPPSNIITAFRVILPNKHETPYWDWIKFQSNKNEKNTILSKQVETELFEDMDVFMRSPDLYSQRGLDYKRGYLLYGPPGCGKSSCIKAMANKYDLYVFNLDLETVKTNSQLLSLMNDMLDEVPDKPYILTIEDFDRHEMFTDKKNYNARKDKVTMQCLLNIIDGVVETHGRILFITCNDVSNIEKVDALIRPGRIDRKITLTYCDSYQASKLISNFFKLDTPIHIDEKNMVSSITPAELIKQMQTTQSIDATLNFICKKPMKINSTLVKKILSEKEKQLSDLKKTHNELTKSIDNLVFDIDEIKTKNTTITTKTKTFKLSKRRRSDMDTENACSVSKRRKRQTVN